MAVRADGSRGGGHHAIHGVAKQLEEETGSAARSVGTTVLRVAQLDSERLTQEVWAQLKQQLRRAFAFLDVATGWELELDLALGLLLFRHTIWRRNQTYGDRLHNIIYRSDARAKQLKKQREVYFTNSVAPSATEKVLLFLLSSVVPYTYARLLKKSQDDGWGEQEPDSWKRRVYDLLYRLETGVRMLSLVNLLVFIREGEFRSIVDRLLGLRLVNHKSKVTKLASFEFMNRQLWWKYATEFLTFIVPLINFLPYLQRLLRRRTARHGLQVVNAATCPICSMNPIQVPHVTDCGHHFCYYCIASRLNQNLKECPVCMREVTRIERPPPKRP